MSLSSSRCDTDLLTLLRRHMDRPLSGAEIGRRLGISRAAVWKRIEVLRRTGFTVLSMAGKGYMLNDVPDTLTREMIGGLLRGTMFRGERYHYLPETDSTNVQAARMALAGAPEGTVVVADRQTHGRGRLGRVWESPAGVNLYFSMILRPEVEPRHTAQMTLISGLALAETVTAAGVQGVEIKWPNDLLLGGGKLAGILTEMAAEEGRVHHVVVGVGLNVNAGSPVFSPQIGLIARSIHDHSQKTIKRAPLLADFLFRFEQWYGHYLNHGFGAIREAWIERSGIRGKEVRVNLIAEQFSGRAVDMDSEGFLLVQRSGDERPTRVIAGDVMPL
ncbi:MAG: biotin--[acetyl-CoA-carboxylase] ligase [Magnetococcales bacterium]|nr:biotin--[acetyl-CoA-carboxylase] ligase [Magnetococcales bacterium]